MTTAEAPTDAAIVRVTVILCEPGAGPPQGIRLGDDLDTGSIGLPTGCRLAAPGSVTVDATSMTADGLPLSVSVPVDAAGRARLTVPTGTTPRRAVITVQGDSGTLTGRVTLTPGESVSMVAVLPRDAAGLVAGSVAHDAGGFPQVAISAAVGIGLVLLLLGIVGRSRRLSDWRSRA